MKCSVLGVGYLLEDHPAEKEKWLEFGINFKFADTWGQAIECLQTQRYSCVIVRTNRIAEDDLVALRRVQTLPVVVIPPEYSAEQRQEYALLKAIQYIHTTGLCKKDLINGDDIQCWIEPTLSMLKPLTIITVKNMSFCLEHRTVEVCGQEVHLTAKEFDILALLICNQRQVFTHEVIISHVWNEDAAFFSKKIVTTHISNLRRKLKAKSDSVDNIESIHGVGYRFSVDG